MGATKSGARAGDGSAALMEYRGSPHLCRRNPAAMGAFLIFLSVETERRAAGRFAPPSPFYNPNGVTCFHPRLQSIFSEEERSALIIMNIIILFLGDKFGSICVALAIDTGNGLPV